MISGRSKNKSINYIVYYDYELYREDFYLAIFFMICTNSDFRKWNVKLQYRRAHTRTQYVTIYMMYVHEHCCT